MLLRHKIVKDLFAQKNPAISKVRTTEWRHVAQRVGPRDLRPCDSLFSMTSPQTDKIWVGRCRSIAASDLIGWILVEDKYIEARGARTYNMGWDSDVSSVNEYSTAIRRELSIGLPDEPPDLELRSTWPQQGKRIAEGQCGEARIEVRTAGTRLSLMSGDETLAQLVPAWSDSDALSRVCFHTTASLDLSLCAGSVAGLALVLMSDLLDSAHLLQ